MVAGGLESADRRVGRNLRRAREAAACSREFVACLVGISENDLRDIECGALLPKPALLRRLAGVLTVPVEALFGPELDDWASHAATGSGSPSSGRLTLSGTSRL